jgi:hypothetical protein
VIAPNENMPIVCLWMLLVKLERKTCLN